MRPHDDLSSTTLGGKLGCLAAAFVGLPVFGVAMFVSFYGDCFDSEQCHQGEGLRWLTIILLTVGVALSVGLLTRKLVNAARSAVWDRASMKDANEDLSSIRDGHWRVQPRWVKTVTVLIGVPAWVVLTVSMFTGTIDGTLQAVAFGAFAVVALLQLVFAFRAYWRMDL